MKILIVGATGATGSLLVEELLKRGHRVTAIVRSAEKLSDLETNRENLSLIQAGVLDLSDAETAGHLEGCDAVASCLGHNLTFRGMFGPPHRLVTDAIRRLCEGIRQNQPSHPVRFVLMNTAGNSNRDLEEPVSLKQKIVIGLLRLLLPPHVDNEAASDYLRIEVGHDDPQIEWAAVRPDNLVDEEAVTEYELHASPVRDAIFNPGKTSRIQVAHFMADLITDDVVWEEWKGQMPVIYKNEKEGE